MDEVHDPSSRFLVLEAAIAEKSRDDRRIHFETEASQVFPVDRGDPDDRSQTAACELE